MSVRPTSRSPANERGSARSGAKGIASADSPLFHGRQSFERREWLTAYTELSTADHASSLTPDDLHHLAIAAYLAGRDQHTGELWARAHQELIAQGNIDAAARCAFWLGMTLFDKGQAAPGQGWIARARRLLDDHHRDSVERGYLLLPDALGKVIQGKLEAASVTFEAAIAIADRFNDPSLRALARQGRGRALTRLGKVNEGVGLLDEAMAAVMADEVSPMIAGIVYCSVIEACYEIFDLRRAQEWTAALGQWCDSQPELVPYRGQCLVRRAEILQFHGTWTAAMSEAARACERLSTPVEQPGAGAAYYRLAEIHRLRGQFAKAEESYRLASQHGAKPEPGLALLRLAQRQVDVAAAAIRRALDEARDQRSRCRVLGAFVEIVIAIGDLQQARAGAEDLSTIAAEIEAPYLRAVATYALGSVLLAEGNPQAALVSLRDACTIWREFDNAYEAARAAALIGLASRTLGDHDMAAMELNAARSAFQQLGARPDLARVAALCATTASKAPGGLTGREVQVLGLVATGKTNRAIADALRISEKTVARHLSNIFTKLDVSTRAAATACAYQHELA